MHRYLGLFLLVALGWATDARGGSLDIYWIDVEGGAATLIVTPTRESVLIDCGNPGQRDPQRIAKVVTEAAGLRRIDHLLVTHFHGDHYGGAATLAKLLPIGIIHDNGEFDGMPEQPAREYWAAPCEARRVIHPGENLDLRTDGLAQPLTLSCLGTRQQFVAAPTDAEENSEICGAARPKDRDGSDNANSVVMLLSYGDFQFLDAGDLTWNQEQKLVCPRNLVGEVDVYQVTHHGLDASNNPLVLQSVLPRVAVMNNGVTKGCAPEVFANLQACPSLEAVYQVHKNERPDGSVNNAPDEYIANHRRDCDGNYIKLSVAESGDRYTVTIPAHGHSRTFQTK